MPSIFVTLVGGPPWGFRIQGGTGTGVPIRLSKVNPGSKAAEHGLLEGDTLKMVNGYLADKLSQHEVTNIIRDAGYAPLTLEIEREPVSTNNLEKIYTTTRTVVVTSPTPKKAWIPGKGIHSDGGIFKQSRSSPEYNGIQTTNGIKNGHCSPVNIAISRNGVSPINGSSELSFTGDPIISSDPPPSGAILVDQKVTVDGDKIHTDKYYAIPVKEVLKEKQSTTKFIAAPEKYDGIGPTEDGIPICLRQSVKKENMSDWYKTMYNTLHKIDNKDDTYVIGYSSDPEIRKEEKHPPPPKHELLTAKNVKPEKPSSPIPQVSITKYPTKSRIDVYTAHPRSIEDYEPGHSSITDREMDIGSRRYFPTCKQPKSLYEYKDGYESESSYFKKFSDPDDLNSEQQKILYREVQHGGDIPQFGLRKPAPEKIKELLVGPAPPPPIHYDPYHVPQASRPPTLPSEYLNNGNENDLGQANGIYANQMRQAIHSELQQKGFQALPLLPNSMAIKKQAVKPPTKKMLARTLYDFVAESPKELSLKKDDIVNIYRELDKNWYEGECKGTVGIFPVNYVEILPPEHVIMPTIKKSEEKSAKVLFDFHSHSAIELEAKKGDEIQIIRKVDDNWYEGRIGPKKGIIPCSYISVTQGSGLDSNRNRPSSLSPSSKDIRSTSSSTSTSDISLSPHMKSNGITSPQNGLASPQNGHHARVKKGNKLIEPVLYRALYRYDPQNADEIQLFEGDDVYIIEMCDDGWYVGTSVRTGELGIIPGNYMQKV